MTDEEEIALAKRLPKGARKALLAMTGEFQLPGRDTFNANAAHNLVWAARSYGGLAAYSIRERRYAFCLTPLGERIKERVAALASPVTLADVQRQAEELMANCPADGMKLGEWISARMKAAADKVLTPPAKGEGGV